MIFSELYSAYYNCVSAIIARLIEGGADERELRRIVSERAFGESAMTVLPSLRSEKWQLVGKDMTTPIRHRPTMPLTDLQKMWLKAISLDPRFALFGIELEGLEDVPPLFTADDYVIYDKYGDGDDFTDEGYIQRFRTILDAIKNKYPLHVEMVGRRGQRVSMNVFPERLEYSEKDDKFRLITSGSRNAGTVSLGRITVCKRYYGDKVRAAAPRVPEMKEVTLTLRNTRNALERVMLHFAHFEKRAEKQDGDSYRLTVRYNSEDEKELIIRILSFGPLVRVEEPDDFVLLIKERLIQQKKLNLR